MDLGGERLAIRGGASSLGWSADDDHTLTIATPGAPDEVARFPARTDMSGGREFIVSSDGRYLALFLYSGQSSQGYELFELRPRFAHIGGMAETRGHGDAPVFSPDGRWLVMFMDREPRLRGTDEYFEDLYDEQSAALAVVDWACLHVLRLPELTVHQVAVGAEIPLSTDPDVYNGWDTYDAVRFARDDVVVLRMPHGPEISVPLPPDGAITVLHGADGAGTQARAKS